MKSAVLAVQLALPLSAPPSRAPVLAAAPGFGAPPAVEAAFRSGDAARFLRAVRLHEYSVPASDEQQLRLLREGLEREEADSRLFDGARRSGKLGMDAFGRALAARNPREGVFQDADAKRAILKDAGYTRLRSSGGGVSLDEASDVRVGRAFAGVLKKYRSR